EFPPPYRPVPGIPIYHVSVGEQVILAAEHDLGGPLLNLVTAVMALGEEVLAGEAARHGCACQDRGADQSPDSPGRFSPAAPSNQVSNNPHGQRWTSADVDGRCLAGQVCCTAGSPCLYLASGRRGHLH
ncbi:MAG TPA: hypothetical protein VG815_16620, partial [Chloroflexota bacterium]|nr:hypothetical protein [Chloroflexota bacterium]